MKTGDCNFERGFCNWKNWENKVEDQFDWKIGRLRDESNSGNTHVQPCGKSKKKKKKKLILLQTSHAMSFWSVMSFLFMT